MRRQRVKNNQVFLPMLQSKISCDDVHRKQILTLIFHGLRREIKRRLAELAQAQARDEGHNDLHGTLLLLNLVRMKFEEE